MEDTLKAPLGDLAHVNLSELKRSLRLHAEPPAARWTRFAPAGLGVAAVALAFAVYRWRRW